MAKTKIGARDKRTYLERALKAADWFVNSQAKSARPWDANAHRFLYYYFMPDGRFVPGIDWTHGRALFVLSDAFHATGESRYADSAALGARYIAALQPLDPAYPVTHGAIREHIPQDSWSGTLDAAQAASGLLMLHRVTHNPDYLRRGRAFCEFLDRGWRRTSAFHAGRTFTPSALTTTTSATSTTPSTTARRSPAGTSTISPARGAFCASWSTPPSGSCGASARTGG